MINTEDTSPLFTPGWAISQGVFFHLCCPPTIPAVPAHPGSVGLPCHSSCAKQEEEPADHLLSATVARVGPGLNESLRAGLFGSSREEAVCLVRGPPVIFIVQGPVWLGVYRILTVLLTCRDLVLCDPGQVSASLWAPESSSVNKEFKDLFRDLLSNRLVDLTEECHILSEEMMLRPRIPPCSPDVHGNRFDLSANPLGCTEQQPACSGISLENLGSCSQGSCPRASRCPHPHLPTLALPLSWVQAEKPNWSLIAFFPSYTGLYWLAFGVTVYRLPVSFCSQSPHLLIP